MAGKVSPGQDFFSTPFGQSTFLNNLIDVEAAYREGRLGRPTGGGSAGDNNNLVAIRNDTGADLAQGAVVKLGAYLLDGKDRRKRWFEGLAVDTTFSRRYAIVAAPTKTGAIGPAYVGGVCVVKYDASESPAAGDGFGPKPSSATLWKGFPSLATVEQVIDSTDKLMLCRLQPINRLLVKTTDVVAAGATTTSYAIYAGTFGSESATTFSAPTAINRGKQIATNQWGVLLRINNGWELREVEVDTAGSGSGPRWFRGVVNEAGGFDESDASISVDGVEALDTDSGEPVNPTVDNPFDLWGDDNDFSLFVESPGVSGNGYILAQVEQRRQPRWFKGTISGTLAVTDTTVSANLSTALDGGTAAGSVTLQNPLSWAGPNGATVLAVEDLSQSPKQYILAVIKHYDCEA